MKNKSDKTFYVFDYLGAEIMRGTQQQIADFLNVSIKLVHCKTLPREISLGRNRIKSFTLTDTPEFVQNIDHTQGFNFISGDLSLEITDNEGHVCDRLDIRTCHEFKEINEALTQNEIEED